MNKKYSEHYTEVMHATVKAIKDPTIPFDDKKYLTKHLIAVAELYIDCADAEVTS